MKFLYLRIVNYRGVPSAEVTFAPSGITLVQGPNEVGKTSLGEAIGLLFEFPDNSKHRVVGAIRPVHLDKGPEIELQAESGPYAFTYYKRFHRKPETRLVVTQPKPENYTGREAHDRAEAILRETIDTDLWKALTIQQGDAIEQPALTNQTSLSAALDKVAGGLPADPREEGLFDRIHNEYSRYYTERGTERKDLSESRKAQADAQTKVTHIEEAICNLEWDIGRAATLQQEFGQLRRNEEELVNEVTTHTASLEEIGALESALSEARLKMESARKSEQAARRDREDRQDLIEALDSAARAYEDLKESSVMSLSALSQADEKLREAKTIFDETEERRKKADTLAALRRADFDYYTSKLHLEQLRERKDRIDQARKSAMQAEELLERNSVDTKVLTAIQDAERAFLTASAKLETGAPNVVLRGLAECLLSIDDSEISLGKEELRTISVADKTKLTIPDMLDVEITAGSSTEELSRKVEESKRALDNVCASAGVVTPDEARRAFEERREAIRHVENKGQVEKDNLRDLTYGQLDRKVQGLQKGVPDYLVQRMQKPAISSDLDAAKKERTAANTAQQEANNLWETVREALDAARSIRDGLNTKHQETRVQLDLLAKDLEHTQESLNKAQNSVLEEVLESNLARAVNEVAAEEGNVESVEVLLKSKNPERAKVLAETAKDSLKTTQTRRADAQTELTEVRTRLRIHGEEGLHEKLHIEQTHLERVEHKNQAMFRRAAAARLLFESMRDERETVRRAYVAPLKDKIERLGRLVFDDTFQVDIDDDLQIASRTSNGVTVPFDSLSGGTKEQISLIFRLACSMIIAEDGGTPLILDDALGYTDPERLRLMGAILAQAAKECQIVIFTCLPDRYSNIGRATIVPIG